MTIHLRRGHEGRPRLKSQAETHGQGSSLGSSGLIPFTFLHFPNVSGKTAFAFSIPSGARTSGDTGLLFSCAPSSKATDRKHSLSGPGLVSRKPVEGSDNPVWVRYPQRFGNGSLDSGVAEIQCIWRFSRTIAPGLLASVRSPRNTASPHIGCRASISL